MQRNIKRFFLCVSFHCIASIFIRFCIICCFAESHVHFTDLCLICLFGENSILLEMTWDGDEWVEWDDLNHLIDASGFHLINMTFWRLIKGQGECKVRFLLKNMLRVALETSSIEDFHEILDFCPVFPFYRPFKSFLIWKLAILRDFRPFSPTPYHKKSVVDPKIQIFPPSPFLSRSKGRICPGFLLNSRISFDEASPLHSLTQISIQKSQ